MNKEIKFDKNLIIIIVLFIVVFVLGFLGWMEFYEHIGREVTPLRVTVLTAGLFTRSTFWPVVVEYMGFAQYEIPILLNIARLTGPFVLIFTGFFVVISIFKKTSAYFFLKHFKKDYILIVGYNEKVHSFINNSNDKTKTFVIFTEEDNIPLIGSKNLIIFDNEKEIIQKIIKLKPYKAKEIFFWHKDDSKNIERFNYIITKGDFNSKSKNLVVYIHLDDYFTFSEYKYNMNNDLFNAKYKVHIFNMDSAISSKICDEYALDKFIEKDIYVKEKTPKIIILGFNKFGFCLASEILQLYIFPNLNKLDLYLIDENIAEKTKDFFNKYQPISHYSNIKCIEYSDYVRNSTSHSLLNIDLVFSCLDDKTQNNYIVNKTRQRFFKSNKTLYRPVIVKIDRSEIDFTNEKKQENEKKIEIKPVKLSEFLSYKTIEWMKKYENIAKVINYKYNHKDSNIVITPNCYSLLTDKEKEFADQEWLKLTPYVRDENIYAARYKDYQERFKVTCENDNNPHLEHDLFDRIEHRRWQIRKTLSGYIGGDFKTDEEKKKLKDLLKIHPELK